ncbi:hypothetical protein EU513_11350 [Yimella sp. RIT 621]|uniref:hypothetical protein n=1 Tax=Yimella sp. RIT 621 TaxID=2510323 RepID=UPI00101CD37B|nr:hypothetical protein [Yimella sp. RIT 621]RYG76562.1 hypothetical protein EU513_11350 [Yimella sp. RIT 621]
MGLQHQSTVAKIQDFHQHRHLFLDLGAIVHVTEPEIRCFTPVLAKYVDSQLKYLVELVAVDQSTNWRLYEVKTVERLTRALVQNPIGRG